MEHWPSYAQSSDPAVTKQSGRRNNAAQKWTNLNYPVLDHGARSAGTLLRTQDGHFNWQSTVARRQGKLNLVGNAVRCYPCTKSLAKLTKKETLHKRSQNGIQFLRAAYPDIDIPFAVVKEQLSEVETLQKQLSTFDPLQGIKLSTSYMDLGSGRSLISLSYPIGPLDTQMVVSPMIEKQGRVVFRPQAKPVWTTETPICQIASSTDSVDLSGAKCYYTGVRTFGKASVLTVKPDALPSLHSRSAFTVKELMAVRPSELDGGGGGTIVDISFVSPYLPDIYLMTDRGNLFLASLEAERKTLQRVFSDPDNESLLWRVHGHTSPQSGFVLSDKAVRIFDTRDSSQRNVLFIHKNDTHVLTHLASSKLEHIVCATATDQVIWLDQRFPKKPLLGWMHHRTSDRTLKAECINVGGTSLSILTSSKNNHATSVAVGQSANGPLQFCMTASSLHAFSTGMQMTSSAIVQNPAMPESFCLMQLSEVGSLHQSEIHYGAPDTDVEGGLQHFHFLWSDDILGLEKQSREAEHGGDKDITNKDERARLQTVYQELFGIDGLSKKRAQEEDEKERVYDLLDRLPAYWQRSDSEDCLFKTALDLVAEMDEGLCRNPKSVFLSENILDSARGFRALNQGKLAEAMQRITKGSPFHANISKTLHRIDPQNFPADGIYTEGLDLYCVDEGDQDEVAARKMDASNLLALDLSLAADTFCSEPSSDKRRMLFSSSSSTKILDAARPEDAAEQLTAATGQLSLSQTEPPQVKFSYLKPVRMGIRQKSDDPVEDDSRMDVEGENKAPNMPLGVRLLLSDWELGSDPRMYEYVDPYGVDEALPTQTQTTRSSQPQSQRTRSQAQRPAFGPRTEVLPASQSQAPPAIIPSRTQPSKPPTVGLARNQSLGQIIGTQSQSQFEPSSSQMLMASTQVVPGPFGGRPGATKKKPVKKRIGGF